MLTTSSTLNDVREYYGAVLRSNADLKTNACCTTEALPLHVRGIVDEIEDEVLDRFYGCGSPIPVALAGCRVLDLGCGTGRDAFVASRLVGPEGSVIAIDMTEAQLAVARRHTDTQMRRFGYQTPNVDFRDGYIEDLRGAGIGDDEVDVVISNCVINLSPDKRRVFSEIFRVLKPGGELLFSDVFADRRLPEDVSSDPVLFGECLGGALYVEDFRRLLRDVGCLDYRIVASSPIVIGDEDLRRRAGNVPFTSMTVRAFKLEGTLEDRCEDYGQVAYYLGTIPEAPHAFVLDEHHVFETGRPVLVCGNTAAMLRHTRYAPHFNVVGDRSRHLGRFGCAPNDSAYGSTSSSCGC